MTICLNEEGDTIYRRQSKLRMKSEVALIPHRPFTLVIPPPPALTKVVKENKIRQIRNFIFVDTTDLNNTHF